MMKLVKFKDLDTDVTIYVNPLTVAFIRNTLAAEMVSYVHHTNIYIQNNIEPIRTSLSVDEVAYMINDALPQYRYED